MLTHCESILQAHDRAAKHTQCENCQPVLVSFLTENPLSTPEATDAYHENVWENCPTCQADYTDFLNSIRCPHGHTELENCEKCLDEWADANAPEYEEGNTALAEELNANPFRFIGGAASCIS